MLARNKLSLLEESFTAISTETEQRLTWIQLYNVSLKPFTTLNANWMILGQQCHPKASKGRRVRLEASSRDLGSLSFPCSSFFTHFSAISCLAVWLQMGLAGAIRMRVSLLSGEKCHDQFNIKVENNDRHASQPSRALQVSRSLQKQPCFYACFSFWRPWNTSLKQIASALFSLALFYQYNTRIDFHCDCRRFTEIL